MKSFKFVVVLMSSVALLASYIILLYTFFSAYLSPSKAVYVSINNLGEANLELVFLMATIPCIIYYVRCFSWSSKKREIWFSETV
ncbi:hypothetical protein LCGC14_1204530 [marine sediment metagenome]|uniref:DUF5671 domain-containing protein n=1 Tax=marine sediment metagenome TaxID=412755 RepID=A0A0F9M3C0_9ZZZZ